MSSPRSGRARTLMTIVLAAAALSGCYITDRLVGSYTGPLPKRVDVVEEAVVVRYVSRDPSGPRAGLVTSMFLDRVRYLEAGDLKSVNRVIMGQTWTFGPRIDSLGIAVGDTVIVSTEYANVHRGGTPKGAIPNWPGTTRHDYPVGLHLLTDIRRKQP